MWYLIVSTPGLCTLTYFNLSDHKIDTCTDFKYLGVISSRNRHFHQTKKHNTEQAKKAIYVLFKRIRNLNIPIDLQLYLFDHVILIVTLYICEKYSQNLKKKILKIYLMISSDRLLV